MNASSHSAKCFRRFGSDVTILQRGPRLLRREDADISNTVRDILSNEGIKVILNAECIEFFGAAGAIGARSSSPNVAVVHGTHLLLAARRQPNIAALGLENTAIKRDAHGLIEAGDELRTSVPGVCAMAGCNGRGAFTQTSYNDYGVVAANLLDASLDDQDERRVTDRIVAYAVYIDPPLGRSGMTESEVRRSGRKALIRKREMASVGRAVEKGKTQGFMKILVDANSHEILGAAILSIGGDEAIHCILDTMYAKAPFTILQRAVNIHPTISELIPTMLGDLPPIC